MFVLSRVTPPIRLLVLGMPRIRPPDANEMSKFENVVPPITLLTPSMPRIRPVSVMDRSRFESVTPPITLLVVVALLNAPVVETKGVPDTSIVPLLNVMLPFAPMIRNTPETSSVLLGSTVVPMATNPLEIRIRSRPPAVMPMMFAPGKKNPVVRSSEKV